MTQGTRWAFGVVLMGAAAAALGQSPPWREGFEKSDPREGASVLLEVTQPEIDPRYWPTMFAGLSNAEVIARLPEVGEYWVRDDSGDSWGRADIVDEMAARVGRGEISAEEFREAFVRSRAIRSSPRWFKGKPYRVWFRLPEWLGVRRFYVASATSDVPGGQLIQARSWSMGGCGNEMQWQESQEAYQLVGDLPEGTKSVSFVVHVKRSPFDRDDKRSDDEWTVTVTLPVEMVDEAEPTPVHDAAITELVRRASRVSCSNGYFQDGPSVWLSSWFRRRATGAMSNVIVRTELTLVDVTDPQAEKVIFKRVCEDPDSRYPEDFELSKLEFLRGAVAAEIVNRQGMERFKVRVRGLPPGEEGNQWCRQHYWAGEYTVPLRDVMEMEAGMRPAGLMP
ncbi:MAG TPA: hypothetical protein VK157_06900 [Phycisphaerales bacterium]|nr:hypothetical protein [Phycisphaerales bacterium]